MSACSEKAIRVAVVNTERRRGGAARIAAALARIVPEFHPSCTTTFFHCEDAARNGNTVGLRRSMSRPLNAMLARLGGAFLTRDLGVSKEILSICRSYDILHMHNVHGYYLNVIKLIEGWGDRPIVWTWHDMWGATGRCGFAFECERWRASCGRCPSKSTYPAAWIDRSKYEHKKKSALFLSLDNLTIVTPSTWLTNIAIARGFPKDRVVTIPNPITAPPAILLTKEVSRSRLNLGQKEPIALFVAADCDDKRKGHADFVTLTQTLGIHAIAIGKAPTRQAAHVSYLGSIKDPVVLMHYYSAADCLIIPSYADNYPNTVLEAMYAGTQVFGYAVGGIPSQVPNPEETLVGPGNIPGLKEKLIEYVNSGAKTPAVSSRISKYATSKWSQEVTASRYWELYQRTTRLSKSPS